MLRIRPLARFALGLLLAALCFVVRVRFASAACPPPPQIEDRIVRVDAYEHRSLGFVFDEPDLVVVPFAAIEVDRPGSVAAWVTDVRGIRHATTLVATSRATGLALLRADARLSDAPLTRRSADAGEATCLYSAAPPLDDADAPIRAFPCTDTDTHADTPRRCFIDSGAPVVDERADVVGSAPLFDSLGLSSPHRASAAAIESLHAGAGTASRERRSWIFYGAGAVHYSFDTATHAVGVLGGAVGIAVRYRDLLELRVDGSVTFLGGGRREARDTCGEPPCFSGVRTMLVPSVGHRIRLAGSRDNSIAVTPSIGYAWVAQLLQDELEGKAPATQALLAPGLALSFSSGELGARVLLPRGAVTGPAVEVSIGFVL